MGRAMKKSLTTFFLLIVTAVGPFLPASRGWAAKSSLATDDSYSFFRARVLAIDKAMGDEFFGTILGYDVLRHMNRSTNFLRGRAIILTPASNLYRMLILRPDR